mmetsp:Transcript_28597/g.68008  ORF Transcript_28597/g.68008 Transcript_28597/m.68008 type:complete len:291 (-) Transcript_28597:1017-1889(-)
MLRGSLGAVGRCVGRGGHCPVGVRRRPGIAPGRRAGLPWRVQGTARGLPAVLWHVPHTLHDEIEKRVVFNSRRHYLIIRQEVREGHHAVLATAQDVGQLTEGVQKLRQDEARLQLAAGHQRMGLRHEALLQHSRAHRRVVLGVASYGGEGALHQRPPLRRELPVQELQKGRQVDLALGLSTCLEDRHLLGLSEGELRLAAGLAELVLVKLVVHIVVGSVEVLHNVHRGPQTAPGDLRTGALHHVFDLRNLIDLVVRHGGRQGVGLPVVETRAHLQRGAGRRASQRGALLH